MKLFSVDRLSEPAGSFPGYNPTVLTGGPHKWSWLPPRRPSQTLQPLPKIWWGPKCHPRAGSSKFPPLHMRWLRKDFGQFDRVLKCPPRRPHREPRPVVKKIICASGPETPPTGGTPRGMAARDTNESASEQPGNGVTKCDASTAVGGPVEVGAARGRGLGQLFSEQAPASPVEVIIAFPRTFGASTPQKDGSTSHKVTTEKEERIRRYAEDARCF